MNNEKYELWLGGFLALLIIAALIADLNRQQRPWTEVLDALRMCHPFRVEHHKRLALLRAQVWRGLGYDLVAERFERFASTLDQETP